MRSVGEWHERQIGKQKQKVTASCEILRARTLKDALVKSAASTGKPFVHAKLQN